MSAAVALSIDFDESRNFFDGCDTVYTLPRYEHPCGPPNPRLTALTMAAVVARCLFTLEAA